MKGRKLSEKTFGLLIASILILCALVVLVASSRYQRHLNSEHQLFEELQSAIEIVANHYQESQDEQKNTLHQYLHFPIDEIKENIVEGTNLVITVFQIHSANSGSPYIDITISGHDAKNPKIKKTISQRIQYK